MQKELQLLVKHQSCLLLHDITYARRSASVIGIKRSALDTSLDMQILLPMSESGTRNGLFPLVVCVVGGGFRTPKVKFRIPWMARLAERGFVVAMPEYRGSETASFPAMMEDIHSAIRYLRKNASGYRIDPDRIVLFGGSAGGHIALQCAYAYDDLNSPYDDLSVSTEVDGVIDLYGTVDIASMVSEDMNMEKFALTPPAQLVKKFTPESAKEALKPANILQYITPERRLPPTLIAHGTADDIVPISQSEMLYNALVKAGKESDFYKVKDAAHADPVFFDEDMMDIYEAFIHKVTEK